MTALFRATVLTTLFCSSAAVAQVVYPPERSVVADGEWYHHSAMGAWQVECQRETLGDDFCMVTQVVTRPEYGVQVEVAVTPFHDWTVPVRADVDVSPRALISIASWSEAPQYEALYAEIVSVDDASFSDYRCLTRQPEQCERGPEVTEAGIRALQDATNVSVSFDYGDPAAPLFVEELNMDGFADAYELSRYFNAATAGLDLESPDNLWEVCSFFEREDLRRITYLLDPEAPFSQPSMRESFGGARGTTDCPSYVILAYFTPEMTPAQRSLFCLVQNEDANGYVGVNRGNSDALRVCEDPSRTACERVNAGREAVAGAATSAAAFLLASGGGTVATNAAGVTVVAHSSQALILTGSAGYIANTLGTAATTALATITSPAWITGAAVTMVVAGGALYVCSGA